MIVRMAINWNSGTDGEVFGWVVDEVVAGAVAVDDGEVGEPVGEVGEVAVAGVGVAVV